MIRIVATADNHLGRYYDRMPPARLEERRRYLREGFRAAVDYAIAHEAHLFLQMGDLFDTPDPRNVEREFVASELARLQARGIRCFGIGGNHDTPRVHTDENGTLPHATYARLGGLRLFGNSVQLGHEVIEIDDLRVAIGGLTWNPILQPEYDPLGGMRFNHNADITLLMAHYGIEGQIPPTAMEPVISLGTLEALSNVDHIFLGHVHHYRHLRFDRRTATMVGATEKMTFGASEGEPGFVYMELEGKEVASHDFIRVPHQLRQVLVIPTEELGEDPPAEIEELLRPLCTPDTMVKLHLEGPLTREGYHSLNLRRIHEFGTLHCFHLDVDTTGIWVEHEQRASLGGVRFSQKEEIEAYAGELYEQAEDDWERELIRQALNVILGQY